MRPAVSWKMACHAEEWAVGGLCPASHHLLCSCVNPGSSKKQTLKQGEMSAGSLGKCLEAKVEVEVGDLRPPGRPALHKRWEEGR